MGFRYHTSVTFSALALAIPEVLLAAEAFGVEHNPDGTVSVSDDEANYGNMDITDILNDYKVDHDHFHSESEGSGGGYTSHVRYANGVRTEVDVDVSDSSNDFLKELHALLVAGDIDSIKSRIESDFAKLPVDIDASQQIKSLEAEISDDDFEGTYEPQQNHLKENAPYNGTMYETFGYELEFVRTVFAAEPGRIWTAIDGEDGKVVIASGFHTVNRIGYFVTKESVPENAFITVVNDE